MNSTKRQTMFMIGVALLIMSGIMIYVSLSSPAVYEQNTTESSQQSVQDDSADSEAEATSHSQTAASVTYPLNINTATYEELVTISGISQSRASAIIEYREYLGSYTSVEQIKEIRGIGDATYAKVSPYLTV